jgi:rhomboid-like protein
MSNAWLTIASRARCAASPAPRQPILQFFRAFPRHKTTCTNATPSTAKLRAQDTSHAHAVNKKTGGFSKATSQILQQSRYHSAAKNSKLDPATPADDAKLQPATTSASHTEGVVETPADEDKGITWRDYDPEGGMPLPDGERSQAEIDAIFGSEGMDVDMGNYILSVMQWRRQSGALIDIGIDLPVSRDVSRSQAFKALEYLRSIDPAFDEQAAGDRWAQEETERLREELRERAVSLKLYKADPAEEEEESDQGTEYGRAKTGESALQRMREHNEAVWEREQAEREIKEQQEQNAIVHRSRGPLELSAGVQPVVALTNTNAHGDVSITGAQTNGWLKPVERKEWVKYYEEQATIIKDNTVPNLSTLQRLGPAALLAIVTIFGLAVLSDNYTPPSLNARIFPDTPPAVTTLGAITAITLAIFVLSRMPPLWRTSSKYFCIVPAYPYAVSLIGAAWRHDTFSHLAANLATLWLFGLSLHEDVGRGTFLGIFLGAGIFGGWVSLARNVATKQWMAYSFGSSGGVLGVAAASCALRPNGGVSIWGVEVPFVAWILVGLYTTAELFGMLRLHKKTNTDHAGHFGGLVFGVFEAYRIKQQQRPAPSVQVMKRAPVESFKTVDV